MATYVLCHGAFGGSYGFRQVRPLLWGAGHEVFTPSLTGIGERSHLTSPMIGLATHVQDLVNVILYEDLHDIVLLGFSYGGMVVTGALDHIGDRVSHLVYLDAFVPRHGQTTAELFGLGGTGSTDSTAGTDGVDGPAGTDGGRWLPPPSILTQPVWTMNALPRKLNTPEATAWSDARRVGQPIRTVTDPVQLSHPVEDWPFTLTYIKATADPDEAPDSAFHQAATHARHSDRWSYHEIDAAHLIPLTHPKELAEILIDLVP